MALMNPRPVAVLPSCLLVTVLCPDGFPCGRIRPQPAPRSALARPKALSPALGAEEPAFTFNLDVRAFSTVSSIHSAEATAPLCPSQCWRRTVHSAAAIGSWVSAGMEWQHRTARIATSYRYGTIPSRIIRSTFSPLVE